METKVETTMELLPLDASYRVAAQKAKELGVYYRDRQKQDIIADVNEKIQKINSGEIDAAQADQVENTTTVPVEEVIPEKNENGDAAENEDQNEKPNTVATANTANAAPSNNKRQERIQQPKWYEAKDAFPYAEGEIVKIVSGEILIGRKAQVLKPSNKKNALKARLIHPVTGELQKTQVTLDFEKIEKSSLDPKEEPKIEKIETQTEVVAESQAEDQVVETTEVAVATEPVEEPVIKQEETSENDREQESNEKLVEEEQIELPEVEDSDDEAEKSDVI